MMDIESYRFFCLQKKGVTENFPFNEQTLVFKVMGKMFSLCSLDQKPFRISLKCDPEKAVMLREEYLENIVAAYHMHKKHWNTLTVEALPYNLVREMIDHSYLLVVRGLPKYQQQQLKNQDLY